MKFALTLIFLVYASNMALAEWHVLSPKESGRLIEWDTSRSKKIRNNHVVYARAHMNGQFVQIKTEINCSKKKHKVLSQQVADNTENNTSETKIQRPWEDIAPDSVFEVLMLKVCR